MPHHETDVIGNFIRTYPMDAIRMGIMTVFFVWFSVPTVLGIVIFFILLQTKTKISHFLMIAAVIVACCFLMEGYLHNFISLSFELHHGWRLNAAFWAHVYHNQFGWGLYEIVRDGFNFLVAVPFLVSSSLMSVNLLPINPHGKDIAAMYKGEKINQAKKMPDDVLNKALNQLADNEGGTTLGVSIVTGHSVILPDKDVNQVVFVLGTTGAGKTITLRRFYRRAMIKGHPLIIVDGKPTDENVLWLQTLANKQGRPFYGFNCAGLNHYDPLANGGYTELKDKIISLKDEWENDYYRSIAEDYLQTTLQMLLQRGQPFDLAEIVKCLNYDCLIEVTRSLKNKELMERVKGLEHYQRSDITGLQAHLNLLIHSELGEYFEVDEKAFQIKQVIEQNAIVYFALPALRFPSFSKVLGKLVINDLKAVIDRQQGEKPVFMVFDEFSVFAGEQVLNLVNMGRGKGVHAIFGTQGLADLDKVDVSFKKQLLNCVNTIICHRLNDHESAETIANWAGTVDEFDVTAQFNMNSTHASLGNVKQVKQFIIHPDGIKQDLKTGEVFLISKVHGFKQDKLKIKYG